MFFLFHGTDTNKARAQAKKNLLAAQKKHPEAGVFKMTPNNFSPEKLDELIGSQGLFYSAFVTLLDHICDDTDIAELFLKKVKELKESPNFFIVLEGKLNKKELEKLTKHAEKVEEFKLPEKVLNKKEQLAAKGERIDFFDFSNALADRNRKHLWALYQEALAEDVASEEIHGIFFWQVKAMIAALQADSADGAGLAPYAFTRSRAAARGFGDDKAKALTKLKKLSSTLFNMYHQAHRGEIDFAVALEKFILEI